MTLVALAKPLVEKLGRYMLQKLSENEHKGSWEGMTLLEIMERVYDEAEELEETLLYGTAAPEEVWREAADIANFAFMYADRYEKLHAQRAQED